MVYESFKNSNKKIEKGWNRSEVNLNNVNALPLIKLDFNSINFNKKIITIPIVTDKLFVRFGNDSDRIQTILLKNFPEWAINMIEVFCVYSISDGFTEFPFANDFSNANNGDIIIISQEFDYWFNNVDETNYNLKIFLNPSIGQKVPEFPSFPRQIPFFITLSLKIVNQRINETMNSHKE